MTGRRRWAALALAVAVSAVQGAPAVAGTAGDAAGRTGGPEMTRAEAVTLAVDHAARTITVTVRLQLGSACTRGAMARATVQGPAAAARCKVGPEVAKAISDNVDRVWNQGLTYYCYTVKVVMDITVADALAGPAGGSRTAPADRHFVAIDQSPVGVRSVVTAYGAEGAAWDGATPADQLVPYNDVGTYTSTWKYPPTWEESLYAHEVGHVIGLSDGYEDARDENGELVGRIRDGAPQDVMADAKVTNVDASTLRRLFGRAGVDPFTLNCDWTVDREIPGGRMTGTKCGGIDGEWVVNADATVGPAHVRQTWVITVGPAAGQDTFTYEDTSRVQVTGSTSTATGEARGTADVRVSSADGSYVRMILTETAHTSAGSSTAGGRTFTLPKTDVPLVNYEFRWLPTVCAS